MDKETTIRPLKKPPATFFEPDTAAAAESDLPPELLYMLKNIRYVPTKIFKLLITVAALFLYFSTNFQISQRFRSFRSSVVFGTM